MQSKLYNTKGEVVLIDDTYMNKNIFRKEFYEYPKNNEREITEILKKQKISNIVEIYKVRYLFFDMELLNTNFKINPENVDILLNNMRTAKKELQNRGIMYIDWKLDNIGLSDSGEYKLFDFDASGIINVSNGEWIHPAPKLWAYRNSINNGAVSPTEIDDMCFKHFEKEVLQLANVQLDNLVASILT
jgi:hypothetical protein